MSLFADCNSNKDIIVRMMDLNTSGKYSRQEVNLQAAERRKELENEKPKSSITPIKLNIPTSEAMSKLGPSSCINISTTVNKNEFIFNEDGSFTFSM